MPLHPRTCSLLYSVSCLLDALDGYAARYFEQSTRFGAVLDMVTDRCTTACLLVFLSSAWPRWALLFQGLISLDLASHYVHMYATLIMGGSDTSHKKVDKSRSFILNLYYTNKVYFHNPYLSQCGTNPLLRRFCSSFAASMRSSSSPSTSSPSPRPFFHRPSSKSQTTARELQAPLSNPETPPTPPHLSCSPILTVPVHWNWRVRTRWIRSGLGSLPVSASQ